METAVKKHRKNARVHREFAEWLLQQGQANKAKTHADRAAKLEPKARELPELRGFIAWQLKDYEEAEKLFAAINQETPENFTAANQLVLALVEQTGEAKRRRALQLALINARLYPNSADALATLAWVYHRLDRAEEAQQAARAARTKGHGTSDTTYYLAKILSENGPVSDMKRLLKSALDAPGRFTFRQEARKWLDQLAKK
jgi:tetratricopeptide (TPR) repeat protein